MPSFVKKLSGIKMNNKLEAGKPFPTLEAFNEKGEKETIQTTLSGEQWRLLIVYRGKHCPLCTRYLNEFEAYIPRLQAINVHTVAVSGDSLEQYLIHREKLENTYPIYHGLTLEQMKSLGLYISHPRSEQETDHPFAEPGLFIINEHGTLQVVDISNNPFVRPDLENLVKGLEWIRQNDYPIRGTYDY